MLERISYPTRLLLLSVPLLAAVGCQNVSLSEIRGRTAAGPEFRNFGTNTHDTRWYARQGVDFKWSNDWTTGVMVQRRDIDDGSGDNENLVLFEVGYPLWNRLKKPEATTQRIQIEELEQLLSGLETELAAAEANDGTSVRFAGIEGQTTGTTNQKESDDAKP